MTVWLAISPAAAHFGVGAPALAQGAQSQNPSAPSEIASRDAEKLFASSCASCHGLDGRGSERAPSVAAGHAERLSDNELFGIIQHGITETGMPSFHTLPDSEITSLVAYLRTLRGPKKASSLPGNPKRGKTLFFGKAGCSGCHMAAGQGGFIASDLSGYAHTHSVDETRSAIINPNPKGDRLARTATVTTRKRERYVGRVRNEDNFSLQLQTLDGTFHFFSKSSIQGVEYSSQSMMPANYGSTLSTEELNDLISYLMGVTNGGEAETPQEHSEED